MDNLPPLKEVLAAHGLKANKALGQHFLLDLNLTDKIARLAAPHEFIIEVGPGPGGLTRSLIAAGAAHIAAIEKDERFVPMLDNIGAHNPGKLSVHLKDALRVDIRALNEHRPLRICANLPYNVGTKLLTNWLTLAPLPWDRMVLMLQKEVAERIAALPGEKAYGRLAVLARSVTVPNIAFEVPARAFTPPPKVDSAVICLDALPAADRFPDLPALGMITAAAFGQRRKMLRRSLKALAARYHMTSEDWLAAANIKPDRRPETLPPEAFHRLAKIAAAPGKAP